MAGAFLPFLLTGFAAQFEPAPSASVSWAAPVDTVAAGDVFIHELPDSLDGVAISEYTASRLPLRSWLLDRSFFWSTRAEDRGDHTFELDAHLRADSISIPFTLRVVVR